MSKQAEGGKARAEKLTPEERSAIAKKGAEARWKDGGELPRETHAGELVIGDRVIPCSVLEDGRRVLSQRAVMRTMGASMGGHQSAEDAAGDAAKLPRFMARKSLIPFIDSELMMLLENPVLYRGRRGGKASLGYEATALPKICSTILNARDAGSLRPQQMPMAIVADMLIRAFAQVGIIALIDEATGYQAERDKDELQKFLALYLTEERLKWVSTFPSEFFSHIFRLKNWKRPISAQARPPMMGKIINKIVYERLPEGVLAELQQRNPVDYESKRRKWKHHQFLSNDVGHPDLRVHIQQLLALMRASRSWDEFTELFTRSFFPNAGDQPALGLEED